MTYSYDAPGVSDVDTIRFLIQDTDPSGTGEWLVTDEEIQWAHDTWYPLYNSDQYVASVVAETIAAKYAREASYSADGVSVGLGQVAQQFRDLAGCLREQYKQATVGTSVDVGGISPDEGLQPGTKPFSFGKGIHDYVEAGNQEWGGIYPPDMTPAVPPPPQEEIVEQPETP